MNLPEIEGRSVHADCNTAYAILSVFVGFRNQFSRNVDFHSSLRWPHTTLGDWMRTSHSIGELQYNRNTRGTVRCE